SSFAEADDAGDVLGAGAALTLVRAAVEHGRESHAAPDIEDADSLGRVELVAGEGEEVDVLEEAVRADVERELAAGLDGVGVEKSAAGVSDSGEGVDGLDNASLVIGVHDADEARVGLERGEKRGGLDGALRG